MRALWIGMVMSAYSQSLIFLLKFAKSLFTWHLLSCNKYVHYAKDTSAYSFFFSFIFVSFGVYSQHSVDRKAKAFYTHSMTEQNCCAK